MGGAGKTTLAAFYARRFRTAYGGGVFKFDAQSSLALHKSLREHVCHDGMYVMMACMPESVRIHLCM